MNNHVKRDFAESDRLFFTTEYRAVLLVACVGLALSLAALWLIRQQLTAHELLDFEWVSHNRIRAIHHGLDSSLLAVSAIRDFYAATGEVNRSEFQLLAKAQLKRFPAAHALMWISRVSDGQTAPRSGIDDRAFGSAQAMDFDLRLSADKLERFSVANIVMSGNIRFATEVESKLNQLLAQAYRSRKMATSGHLQMMHDGHDWENGFVAGIPVYPQRNNPVSVNHGESREPLGFVVGFFGLYELVNSAVSLLEPRGVEILLTDDQAEPGEQFLHFYTSRLAPKVIGSTNYIDWLSKDDYVQVSEKIRVANHTWQIICKQTAEFRSAEAFQKGPWAAMITGLLFTVLISSYLVRMNKSSEERMLMQQQLIEREELFRQMTETVDEAFWAMTAEGDRLLYFSPAYQTIFHRERDEDQNSGLPYLDSLPKPDQKRLLKMLEQVRKSNTVQELVHRVFWEDGTTRWVRTRGFPVTGSQGQLYRIVGFIEDITDKKLADEALRESESKLRELFQQSPDIIMTVDSGGKILLMNRSIPALPAERAVGRNSLALMPSGLRRWFRRELKSVFNHEASPKFEYSADDGTFWAGRIVPILADGHVTAAMVIASDVTEKRNLEIQAQRNARLASIGVLSAGVAHEINNPNNAINFNAGLVERAWRDVEPILGEYFDEHGDFALGGLSYAEARETFPKLLGEIARNSERIRKIVENLKHMARQDPGRLSESVDIQQVLESTLMILHNQIQKHTDYCTLEESIQLPSVKGNSQQLEQVFINVLFNALQSLSDRTKGVFLSTRYDEPAGMIEICVRDEGCGISERDLGRLTEPFFTTRTNVGGTGLGLSITRSIVEKHGGSLVFESELGTGTRVYIRLPVGQGT